MKTIERLAIDGMTCGHCVRSVRGVLEEIPGVEVHDVTLGAAEIAYDDAEVTSGMIAEAIAEEGYRVQNVEHVVTGIN